MAGLFRTLALAAAALLAAQAARADEGVTLGVEINAAYRVEDDAALTLGSGGSLRLGYMYPNGVTPQVLLTGAYWTGAEAGVEVTGLAVAALAGLRWTIVPDLRARVSPWLGAHAGGALVTSSAGDASESAPGVAIVAGGGFDFPIPIGFGIAVGTHFTYNRIVGAETDGRKLDTAWLVIGADLTLLFQ